MYVRQCKWTLLPHPTPPHPVNPMKDIETCKTLVRFSTRRLKHVFNWKLIVLSINPVCFGWQDECRSHEVSHLIGPLLNIRILWLWIRTASWSWSFTRNHHYQHAHLLTTIRFLHWRKGPGKARLHLAVVASHLLSSTTRHTDLAEFEGSHWLHWGTRWCPSSLAKLVNITPITLVYGRYM